jgi:hypothetical protein
MQSSCNQFSLFQRCLLLVFLWSSGLVGCSTVPTHFSPVNPLPIAQFRHDAFDAVLREHVLDGTVDYPAIARDVRFNTYLRQLDRIDPSEYRNEHESLAFWINAYNALAIQGILAGDSPSTTTGKYRYFIGRKFRIGGGDINLWGLEHQILIPRGEPRVHFAIVCASASCPVLRSEAFDPERLDAQLDGAARQFINDVRRNRFDRSTRTAQVSMIFDWYRDEFERVAGSLARYLGRYVNDPAMARALSSEEFAIEFLPYDWSLNGIAPR